MVTEKMIEAAARRMAVADGQNPDKLSHNSFEWWRHYAPMARAALEAALSTDAEPVAWQPRYKQEVIDHHKSIGSDLWEYAMTVYPTKGQAQGYGYGGHECRALYAAPPAPSVAVKALEDAVRKELEGIDKEETYDSKGWWETSTGSSFGAEKLNAVLLLIRTALSTQVQDVAELTKSAVEDALDKAADLAESPCACRSCGAVVPSSYAGECCSSPNIDTATPQQIGAAIRALPAAPAAKLEGKP